MGRLEVFSFLFAHVLDETGRVGKISSGDALGIRSRSMGLWCLGSLGMKGGLVSAVEIVHFGVEKEFSCPIAFSLLIIAFPFLVLLLLFLFGSILDSSILLKTGLIVEFLVFK